MTQTVRLVEKEIEKALAEKFALMIGAWSEMGSSTHYVGVYAFLPSKAGQTVLFSGICGSGRRNFIHRRQSFGIVGIRLECLQ